MMTNFFMAYRQKRIIARKTQANRGGGREPWSNVKIFLNTNWETVKLCKCSINADELWYSLLLFFPLCKKKHIFPWFKQAMHIMKKKEKKAKIVSIFSFRVSARTSQWSIEAKLVCASRILTLELRFIARATFENKWKVRKNYVIHKHNEFFLIFFSSFIHSFGLRASTAAVATRNKFPKLEEE